MNVTVEKRPGDQMSAMEFDGEQTKGDWNNWRLEWVRGKRAVFKDCNFSSSLFKSCYFHQAKFINCDFTGAFFQDSNFRGATFDNCKFEYAQFRNTLVDANQLLRNLPSWENTRRELLRSLRKNAESIGEVEEVRRYFLKEMEAGIEHWRSAAKGASSYYLNHYPGFMGRFTSTFRWINLMFWKMFWGHGDSPLKLLLSTISTLGFLAVLANHFFLPSAGIGDAFLLTVQIALGIPGLNIASLPPYYVIVVVLVRYTLLGLFGSLVVRRFARR